MLVKSEPNQTIKVLWTCGEKVIPGQKGPKKHTQVTVWIDPTIEQMVEFMRDWKRENK